MSDLNNELIEQLLQRIDLLEKAMKKSKKANKDYDGDGEVESGTEEYMGSRDKAIKKAVSKKKLAESLERLSGNFSFSNPRLSMEINKIEKTEIVEEVKTKLHENTNIDKKFFKENGTKVQLSENMVYGGFPRVIKVIKEGEESESLAPSSGNPHGELEKHMSVINRHGEMLHKTNHPHRQKFGKMWSEFSQGKFDNANELIEMGADPTAVGNYIKIKTSPEYKAYMAKVQSEISPESMGYGRPGSGSRYTGD